MEFIRAFVGDILTIAAYAAVFAGIYKLFEITTALGEIKQLLQAQRRADFVSQGSVATPVSSQPSHHDDATAYAENLLRAVAAESQRSGSEAKPV